MPCLDVQKPRVNDELGDPDHEAARPRSTPSPVLGHRYSEDEEHLKKSAEIAQLHGRLAELRHQLESVHRRAEAEAARRDDDLAAANAKADRLKAQNDELTADLQRARDTLANAPPATMGDKLHELQGALRQAVQDYELLLHELGHVRADVRRKDEAIAELRARLQEAGAATEQRRHENEELEKLLTELEARMRPAQPASPPAAGLPSDWHRERSADGSAAHSPQPARTIAAHRQHSMERSPRLEREARPTLGASSPGEVGHAASQQKRERMRMIPPTGFW